MTRTLTRSAVLIAALASAALVAGCTATPQALVTLSPSTTPTVEVSDEPDGSVARPYDFGVLVPSDEGSMWTVTITDPIWNAADVVAQGNPYNVAAPEGSQYVIVTISARTAEEISPDSLGQLTSPGFSLSAAFVGNDGHVYTTTTAYPVIANDWLMTEDIIANPGVDVSGQYVMEIPTAAIPGGNLAVKNLISGNLVYFGPPAE